jgi:hypothetical protein
MNAAAGRNRDIGSKSLRDEIEQIGFVVARNVLAPDEVARLRSQLVLHFKRSWQAEGMGKHQPNAAVEVPEIHWIFTHPPILSFLRELYGQTELVFTGNCDVHMNMLSWWHKDATEKNGGSYPGDFYSRADCNALRVGIYLQGHEVKNGLTVRRGSHRFRSQATGEIETLKTHTGDVIFFDSRLTHAGQFASAPELLAMRFARRCGCARLLVRLRCSIKKLVGRTDKLSAFFTYAVPGPATDYRCAYEHSAKKKRGAEYLPDELTRSLKLAGVSYWPAMARPAAPEVDNCANE